MTHVLIIGAYGSAGVAVANALADSDVRLTLVDDNEPGGLCILRGCMPSKEVLSAGAHRFQARHDDRLSGVPSVALDRTVDTKDEHTAEFGAHRREAVRTLTDQAGIEFIHDTARCVNDTTVAVGTRELSPDYVVVATGSKPSIPELPGIDDIEFMTSADVLDATSFPDSGIVLGFGAVGIELVPYLAEVGGVDLTVIEHGDRPLDGYDAQFGDELLSLYRETFGVDIRTNTRERALEATEQGVRLTVEEAGTTRTIDAEGLFVFTGRRPALDGLGLGQRGIEPSGEWVQDTMQARDDEQTFVVGDANDKEPILHVAKEQGHRAADNILRHRDGRTLRPYENVTHRVVFAGLGVYPVVRIGHTATSARTADIEHITVDRQASDDGVFITKDAPEGVARLVVGTDGTVLGYQGLHYHADVMAKTMQIVLENEMDIHDIPDRAYHPTTPEILDGLLRGAKQMVSDSKPSATDLTDER
ncbi:FAD-dependent oxidoreductase [Halocatena pleomorpha]|uniref:NAD(P)/FAD-dependent oxidoreductase n=1 Tax=Halocatena pleomorpha TaxID=1785090 RepID=A0A3P3R523_9EURY|nr:NAD(P)/FAD-dependent oxidoreductase [Halocatena pleomorpha]RRJ28581.1 NAD(P)/FAD-dependent oxidoreductase [Halocatena pleomorpha]